MTELTAATMMKNGLIGPDSGKTGGNLITEAHAVAIAVNIWRVSLKAMIKIWLMMYI